MVRESTDTSQVSGSTHLFLVLMVLMCGGFIAWSAVGKLDVVSLAQGEIIPKSKVKQVEHLEGGIVRDILVQEGDEVQVGESLVVLEETRSGASVQELRVRLNALLVDVCRLEAEVQSRDMIDFPKEIQNAHPNLVRQAENLFQARKSRLQSQLNECREAIRQREHKIEETKSRLANNRKQLGLLQEQIDLSTDLLKDNLTTRYKHLELLRQAARLEGLIDEDSAALRGARSALNEAREKLKTLALTFQEEASEEHKEAKQEMKELVQRLRKFEDSLERTVIRSPVAGVVKTLYVVTKGGVIKPGEPIADIVPSGDRLVVQAHLPVRDIGYIQEGQRAVVKLASSDARKFGQIEGRVVQVSPDTLTDDQGRTFYPVRVETEQDHFSAQGMSYRLYPGMFVMVSIHTGQRTVLEYLVDPFVNSLSYAFQER